ncbi:hypothetical protein V6N11_034264 [Hibiscus sabdariffa]|uniref:Bulb-type lectin domain-containing protein n=1 Tax=Hibiscus sabdariffa TaxID=183260 RepID=A0ABR2N887_9ROSI
MNSVKWLIRILLIFFLSHFSISADTISLDHFIQDNNNEVIVSAGNIFELGFFSPGISTYRYVGIWYFQIPVKTPVWVANRDNPINDTSGVLRIDARGNLALFQGNQTLPVWSTNISIAGPVNSFAQILDSGNLVLLQNDSKKAVLWQSFGHPTNTWLSHMKIGFDLRTGLNQSYTSWKSPDDPGVGNISFRMNPGVSPQMVLYKGSVPLWRSGTWTGKVWSGIPQMAQTLLFNRSFVDADCELSFSSDSINASLITRYVTNETGVTQRILWNNASQSWIISYTAPYEQCDFYRHCGPNGYCNPYSGSLQPIVTPQSEPLMNPVQWLLMIHLIFFLSCFSSSADIMTQDHFIRDKDEMIISSGKIFALGFFGPGNSRNRYVGIWYHQIQEKVVVWVANRDNPIKDNSGILRIDGRGNLALFQGNQTLPVWSTNIAISGTRNSIAQILDSGNLVLLQSDTRKVVLWQSFDHPTNTWLGSMKLGLSFRTGLDRILTSWKSPDDPGCGNYSLRMNSKGFPQMVLYKGSTTWWRSGPWTGRRWSGMPGMTNNFILNDYYFVNSDDEVWFSASVKNASIITRSVTNETGILEGLIWNHEAQRWISVYSHPKEQQVAVITVKTGSNQLAEFVSD